MINEIENLDLYQWHNSLPLALSLSSKDPQNDWRFIAEPCFRKHREAWCLSRFAFGYEQYYKVQAKVKMVPDTEEVPDGLMGISDEELQFDVTMVLDPNRRMAEEAKQIGKNVATVESGKEDLHLESVRYPSKDEVLRWLKDRLKSKFYKAYPGLNLLVYLNTWQFPLEFSELSLALKGCLMPWKQVWMICSSGWDEQYALTSLKNPNLGGWYEFNLNRR